MTPRLVTTLLAAGALFALAACGQDDPTPTATSTPVPPPTATPATAPGATGEQAVEEATVTLNPGMDTTLYDEDGSLANGAGEFIFAGVTRIGAVRRGLIAFDVPGAIPAGATVLAVTLTMNLSQTTAGPEPVSLHAVLTEWSEGASDAVANEGKGAPADADDATWTATGVGGAAWNTPGGDFAEPSSASIMVTDKGQTFTWGPSPEMTADVQGWLDDPSANFGWLLLANEEGTRTAKRFDSRQNIEGFPEPQPPVLTVTYLPPP